MSTHTKRVADLRFLVEPSTDGEERRHDPGELHAVAVGHGVRALHLETFASNPQLAPASPSRGLSTRALHFETLSIEKRAALLMLTPPCVSIRVNDRPSPIVAVLNVGDQLQVGDTVLHLTQFREFTVGPPSPELLGSRCGVCRVPFDEQTRVYVHECGQGLHLESASIPAEKRLECALLGDCPNCGGKISLESGFSFMPEL